LTVPRRKGGKRCVRLRTARETAALHTAQLESRSKGWFDRGRLDPHDDRPKDKPTSGLLRSATFLAVPHNNGKTPAQEARSNAYLDGGKLDPGNNGPKDNPSLPPSQTRLQCKRIFESVGVLVRRLRRALKNLHHQALQHIG
jgi:hypothetical protein